MRLILSTVTSLLVFSTGIAQAKSWGFQDATVSVQGRGASAGSTKQKFPPTAPVAGALTLGSLDTLKVSLTTAEDKKATRANQAFLTLREANSGLEDSFPLKIRETGSGKVELTQKDLPNQLLLSDKPLRASIVIGSFGSSTPLNTHVFDLEVKRDQSSPPRSTELPPRYGKLEEIHHIFRADPKSPPKLVSLVFTAIALATLPALFGIWLSLGANVNHLSAAFGSSPLSHAAFLASIFALEGIFFLYYRNWTLFQMLPAAGVTGLIAFLSGSRALSEVQGRRLAGKR